MIRRPPRSTLFPSTPLFRSRSRCLHETVCRAVADRFAAAGVIVPEPQAAFYLYPDFAPWREHLAERHGVTTGPGLAALLRSEEHTSELQSQSNLVCRLLLEK